MKTNPRFRLNRTLYFGETKIPASNYPLLQEKQSTLYWQKKNVYVKFLFKDFLALTYLLCINNCSMLGSAITLLAFYQYLLRVVI